MIRRALTDADLERCAAINNAVNPESPVVVADLREQPRGGTFLLHDRDGYTYVVRSSVPGNAYAMVRVHPGSRRAGVGSALLKAAADEARRLGLHSMWGRVQPDDEASLAFARRRGFDEIGRDVLLVRELRAGDGDQAAGVVELREEHRRGAYAVAVECTPDMAVDPPAEAPPFEEWAAEELAGPVAFVALEGDRVVGYAALHTLKAQPDRLEHGLTAVLRSRRGRGLAQALKRAQIAWAASRGYRELVTETQVPNAAMRAVNVKLGYVERPGAVVVGGPIR